MTANEKLTALRAAMKNAGVDAYIIPSADPHQSEYVADHWKIREWASGFTGSAGYLSVDAHHAGLWTDSRYTAQAEHELTGTDWRVHAQNVQGAPEHIQALAESLKPGSVVGCDGRLFSTDSVRAMKKAFDPKDIRLVTNVDLASSIWKDRPAPPPHPVFEHPDWYAGRSRAEKLSLVRQSMQKNAENWRLITTLDDIAWTLNLRGADVESNPTFIAYLVVGDQKSYLFIDDQKVPEEIKIALRHDGVHIKPYNEIDPFLHDLNENQTIGVDPDTLSRHLELAIREASVFNSPTPTQRLKACKNETELRHIRYAMVKDGVALTRAFRWIEQTLAQRTLTEYEIAAMLAQYRSQQADYMGESFNAIVSYKKNGGVIHYRPTPENSAIVEKNDILLIDSGGQYIDGTTDITRTIALGEPTAEQKLHFTLVLKGMIALSMLKFPVGTRGVQMDAVARIPLWEHGLNYPHGTGHGVGYFLNVHEPPQGFTPSWTQRGKTVMEAGMLTSNEPGFYKDGEYGIRIENLIVAVPDEKYPDFLRFDTVTLFPIDQKMTDVSLLDAKEKNWLNQYHQTVRRELAPHLNPEERDWLAQACKEIG